MGLPVVSALKRVINIGLYSGGGRRPDRPAAGGPSCFALCARRWSRRRVAARVGPSRRLVGPRGPHLSAFILL